MADDPKLREQDSKTIALHEAHEVRTWRGVFGCTEAELKAAVASAGKGAKAVREYFEKNPPVSEKLRIFRDGLPKDQRRVYSAMIAGAAAGLRPFREGTPPAEKESFAQRLIKFREGLPPTEREAVTAMVLASGMAWAVAANRERKAGGDGGDGGDGGEGDQDVIYFWIEVAKAVALLIISGSIVADIIVEDDPEIVVPDIHFPD